MKIALDAMGGDFAPATIVAGAIQAVKEFKDIEITLVGKNEEIEKELLKFKPVPRSISILHASEVIEMHEPAAASVRRKKDSSIVKAIGLLENKTCDAFVSAGNTGAVVCAATLNLGLLPGIERPGIAILIPTLKGVSLMIDVGANIDPKPDHLFQYAVMANVYFQNVLNKMNPSVGLLNIGEEETKGTDFVKETHKLLSEKILNFIGNVEGKDIFSGNCDCVICDGFVGNIALKVSESLAETLSEFLKQELTRNIFGKIGILLLRASLIRFKKKIDYSEYGGAPLLGVDGIVIICHGRSNVKAIKNAIGAAKKEVERNINIQIIEEIKRI
ncbi:MAG: phosphate acyltransferase PlsX [Candidatus Omnitrophota bacterium]|nr:phosphate acyltransferase PlsX [Candidatus Omnitrophota bacterium]